MPGNSREKKTRVLHDRLQPPIPFDKADKLAILCLVGVFTALFVYLLVSGQLFFAYLTFNALLTLICVGILRATGVFRNSWMVLGGGAAVYVGFFVIGHSAFEKHTDQTEAISKLRAENDALKNKLAENDPAKRVLLDYMEFLQRKAHDKAYALLANAYVEERRKLWGESHFEQYRSTFTNTRSYDSIAITGGGDGQKYTLSYDVIDDVPPNELTAAQKVLFGSSIAGELLNRDEIVKRVIANVRQYYAVPDAAIERMKSLINNMTVENVFDPVFVANLERRLREADKIALQPNPQRPGTIQAKRHFFHEAVIMVNENGTWRIRTGLGRPLVANY